MAQTGLLLKEKKLIISFNPAHKLGLTIGLTIGLKIGLTID